MNLTRIKALGLMRYHLMKQDQWQRKAEAREKENHKLAQRQLSQGRLRSHNSWGTPLEYYQKRIDDEDFWLKQYASNRDHHQKQAMMWAQAAEALRETTDAE